MSVLDEILIDLCREIRSDALVFDPGECRFKAKKRIKRLLKRKIALREPSDPEERERWRLLVERIKRL